MILKYLLQKEFLQMRRNSFLPRLIFAFPIVLMCVMPWVMSMEVKNVVVDVVDNDRSVESQRLVHTIEESRYFVFHGQQPDYRTALKNVERSDADIVMVVPQGWSKATAAEPKPVLIAANAVNGMKGSIGGVYLSQIVMSAKNPDVAIAAHAVNTLNLYNTHQDYKVFMIPALTAILLMLLCGFLPALNIVSEKETGTIEQINVTPVSRMTFILSKLIPYWLVGLVVLTIALLLSWLVYGITCQGPLVLVYLLAVLLALIFSGIGLTVSNYSDTMQQAVFVMWFIVVVMMLMSGFFTPVRSMPDWAQALDTVNPMRYFIDAIRTVFIRGGTLSSVFPQVLVLSFFALLMDVWAVLSYRKNT